MYMYVHVLNYWNIARNCCGIVTVKVTCNMYTATQVHVTIETDFSELYISLNTGTQAIIFRQNKWDILKILIFSSCE